MPESVAARLDAASARRREERLAAARSLATALGTRGATRVLLFGSLAAPGTWIGENSDVDLAVVMPGVDAIRFHRRLSGDPDVGAFPFALDLLVYTPEEWARLCRDRGFVRDEVAGRGLTLV